MGRVLHLLLLDVDNGRITDLFAGTDLELPRQDSGSAGYDTSPDGRSVVFNHDPLHPRSLDHALALSELDIGTRRLRPLAHDPAWDFSAPRYSPCGQRVAAVGAQVGRVHTALGQVVVIELRAQAKPRWNATGTEWDHAVNAPLRWSPDGKALYFTAEESGRCHLWRHDWAQDTFEVVHAGGWVQNFDVAGDVLAVAADSALHPVQVHARVAGGAARRLENFNDDLLRKLALGNVQEVQLQGAADAASGSAVQMWLTFPPGFKPGGPRKGKSDGKRRGSSKAGRYPITHVIHGGPFAAAGDTFSYRWNPHVFAAAGHVVAQVNYHGSSGFGHAFRHSLIGRQGQLELQDIEAATDWLLQQPWADASRVFATGGSYGGFLVAWMNGHIPAWPQGRYRAYVCHAGVFDRVATFSADSYPERPKDLAARFWEDMPRVLAQSPHNFAAQMNTPTLVIHGARDYRVPDCNGLAYYNTLKARGVDARLLWFADENHWVLKPQNSLQWYAEFARWLGRHGG
jgi:dipeptidyl aminopeptidase/acylaminoacyl peptidase